MKYFETYHWHIVKFHLRWAWNTRQPRYIIGITKAVLGPEHYDTWWKAEVCRIYRVIRKDGLAFSDNYIGLPSKYSHV